MTYKQCSFFTTIEQNLDHMGLAICLDSRLKTIFQFFVKDYLLVLLSVQRVATMCKESCLRLLTVCCFAPSWVGQLSQQPQCGRILFQNYGDKCCWRQPFSPTLKRCLGCLAWVRNGGHIHFPSLPSLLELGIGTRHPASVPHDTHLTVLYATR